MKNPKLRGGGIVRHCIQRRRTATAFQRQASFGDLMTQLLMRFAACTCSDIDASILAAVQAIAEFAGADYAYVMVLSADRLNWSVSHDWCAPDMPSTVKHYQNVALGTLSWSESRLLAGEILRINAVDDYPLETVADREDFKAHGIQSLISVPISGQARRVFGTVGFLSFARRMTWSGDVARLKIVGDAIAHLMERKRTEENLERQLEHVAALRTIDFAIANSLDLRVALNVFVDEVVRQLQVDAAAVLLLNPQTCKLEYAAGRGFQTESLQRTSLLLGQGHACQAALERRRAAGWDWK